MRYFREKAKSNGTRLFLNFLAGIYNFFLNINSLARGLETEENNLTRPSPSWCNTMTFNGTPPVPSRTCKSVSIIFAPVSFTQPVSHCKRIRSTTRVPVDFRMAFGGVARRADTVDGILRNAAVTTSFEIDVLSVKRYWPGGTLLQQAIATRL